MKSLHVCVGLRTSFSLLCYSTVLAVCLLASRASAIEFIDSIVTSNLGQNLDSFTDSTGTYNTFTFVNSVTGGSEGNRTWLSGQADPGSSYTALSDTNLATGILGTPSTEPYQYAFAASPSDPAERLFFFMNVAGNVDEISSVSAFDSSNNQVGASIDLIAALGPDDWDDQPGYSLLQQLDLDRSNGGTLVNRGFYCISLAMSAFGGTVSDISYVTFDSVADNTDFQLVGFTSAVAAPTAAVWAATGGGGWGTASNWDINAVPANLDTTFGPAITSNATVTLGEDRAVQQLAFNDNNSYTLSGNSLSINGDVTTQQGSHTIQSNVVLSGGVKTFTSNAGAALNITGPTTIVGDAAGTIVLDGAGGGSIGAIREGATDDINVIKRGSGTWNIGPATSTATDFHRGSTTIEEGTLKVNGAANNGELGSPLISIRDGATLDATDFGEYTLQIGQTVEGAGTIDVTGGSLRMSGTAQINPGDDGPGVLNVTGNMSINAGLGGTGGGFVFELSNSAAGNNDQIAVSGNLTTNAGTGTMTVSIIPTGSSLASQYELITANSVTGSASNFVVDSSFVTRFTQSISVDSNSVNLNITGSNSNLTWAGAPGDNAWRVNDPSADSWTGGAGGDNKFYDLDSVNFTNTAAEKTVNVDDTVSPSTMTINNSAGNDYTFSGTGAIAGPGSVTKSGTGRATISTANTYTGVTTITGGTLHAANDAALGSDTRGTTVNGGTLDITSTNIGNEVVTIQGAGVGGRGALITDGPDALGGGTRQISHVIQSGDATIGAYAPDQAAGAVFAANDYRWDLEPATNFPDTNASWQGNGHTLTKKGRGTVSIQRVGDMGGGDINVEQGILFWQGSTTSAGATVTIGDGSTPWLDPDLETGGASFNTFYAGGTGPAPVGGHNINLVFQGGSFSHQAAAGFQDTSINGTVTNNDVSGDSTIDNVIGATNGNRLTIVNGITGDGDLQFAGSGTIELQGNSTYTGRTEVTTALALTGSGRLSGTPRIALTDSIDVTGRTDGRLSLAGQTLSVGVVAPTATVGEVTAQVVASQDTVLRYNPQNPDIDTPDPDGSNQLFAGVVTNTQTGGPVTDLTRSVMQFDLSSVPALGSVTDIAAVTLTLQNNADGGSAGTTMNVEIHELQQAFVDTEASANEASSGVLWTGYTLDGDADPNAAGAGALGSLLSVVAAAPGTNLQIEFPDNQGGAPFESLIESTLAGSGSLNLLVKVDNAAEGTDRRDLFRFSEEGTGGEPVLNITFNGAIADTVTASVLGDFEMDASSTLEVDVFSSAFADLLDISGSADLAGVLDVSLISGNTLAVNDTVTVLTAAGGIVDNGLSVSGPFTHAIVGNDLVLTFTGIVAGLPGDFNGDGVVDAVDYAVWRENLGALDESALNGNGDNMNGVDSGDFALWRSQFGATSPGAVSNVAAPEPSSILLIALALFTACGAARRS